MKANNQKQATPDSFTNKFIAMYKDKSNDDFKNSLVVCLLKAFVAKMSGESIIEEKMRAQLVRLSDSLGSSGMVVFTLAIGRC
eukprot:scaffold8165_cov69-Attheya_sp.AAC.1